MLIVGGFTKQTSIEYQKQMTILITKKKMDGDKKKQLPISFK